VKIPLSVNIQTPIYGIGRGEKLREKVNGDREREK
jgi:hypothetical protein